MSALLSLLLWPLALWMSWVPDDAYDVEDDDDDPA